MSDQKYWFIETEDGKRIEGPFRTNFEANQRRTEVERRTTETFWIRESFVVVSRETAND